MIHHFLAELFTDAKNVVHDYAGYPVCPIVAARVSALFGPEEACELKIEYSSDDDGDVRVRDAWLVLGHQRYWWFKAEEVRVIGFFYEDYIRERV